MEERFETFTALITMIGRSIRRIKTQEVARFQLKGPHVSCLYYLYKKKSLTSSELCLLCEEDKANLSRTLDYLEERGYLAPRIAGQKRYRSPLTLTEEGARVGAYIAERVDRVLTAASEGVSESDRRTMYESLTRISENLQRYGDYEDEGTENA